MGVKNASASVPKTGAAVTISTRARKIEKIRFI